MYRFRRWKCAWSETLWKFCYGIEIFYFGWVKIFIEFIFLWLEMVKLFRNEKKKENIVENERCRDGDRCNETYLAIWIMFVCWFGSCVFDVSFMHSHYHRYLFYGWKTNCFFFFSHFCCCPQTYKMVVLQCRINISTNICMKNMNS